MNEPGFELSPVTVVTTGVVLLAAGDADPKRKRDGRTLGARSAPAVAPFTTGFFWRPRRPHTG